MYHGTVNSLSSLMILLVVSLVEVVGPPAEPSLAKPGTCFVTDQLLYNNNGMLPRPADKGVALGKLAHEVRAVGISCWAHAVQKPWILEHLI